MKHFLAYFVAVLLCVSLHAQSWDTALDQYEQISEECIRLRQKSLSGEKVSGNALVPLLNRLATLRKSLQTAGGNMSVEQKRRFESIRNRYDVAFGVRKPVEAVSSYEPDPILSLASLPSVPESDRPSPEPVRKAFEVPVSPVRVSVILFAGIPDFNPGLMLSVSKGRWGGFLKGSSTVTAVRPSYFCYADGTTDTGYIWTSGKEAARRFSLTAGGIFSPLSFLSVYMGAGYGTRQLLWEDAAGGWAAVKDRSASGITVDAGVLLSWRHLSVMAGASAVGLKAFSAELGIGYRF